MADDSILIIVVLIHLAFYTAMAVYFNCRNSADQSETPVPQHRSQIKIEDEDPNRVNIRLNNSFDLFLCKTPGDPDKTILTAIWWNFGGGLMSEEKGVRILLDSAMIQREIDSREAQKKADEAMMERFNLAKETVNQLTKELLADSKCRLQMRD